MDFLLVRYIALVTQKQDIGVAVLFVFKFSRSSFNVTQNTTRVHVANFIFIFICKSIFIFTNYSIAKNLGNFRD